MPQIPPDLALERAPFDLETLDEAIEGGGLTDELVDRESDFIRDDFLALHRWQITDDGAAEWSLRHIAAIDAEERAVLDQYALWLEPISAWRDQQLGRLGPRRAFFENHLKRYGLAVRADDPRRATVSLPSGKISTRVPSGPVVEVTDEERVIEWAAGSLTDEEYEAVVRTTRKVLVSEIRKRVHVHDAEFEGDELIVWRGSGEIVPGLAARQAETTATVTPAP